MGKEWRGGERKEPGKGGTEEGEVEGRGGEGRGGEGRGRDGRGGEEWREETR